MAAARAVAHLLGVLARTVRGPIGDRIALTAQVDDAVASLLVGGLVIVAADDGAAVAAAALVAVPEDFHQVARHGACPDVERTPFTVGEIALIGRFLVAFAFGTAICGKTVACTQFAHQHAQSGPVGIGASPKTHAVVLPHPVGVKCIGDAYAGFHVYPRFALDFVLGIPDEQGLDDDRVGCARAERRLCQHRVKLRPLVAWRHLVSLVQALPGRLGKQVVGTAARVVASPIGKRVDSGEHRLLPSLVHLVASGGCASQAQ